MIIGHQTVSTNKLPTTKQTLTKNKYNRINKIENCEQY